MQGSQRIPKTIHICGKWGRAGVANQGLPQFLPPSAVVAFAGCCITWLGRRIAANVFGGWFRLHLSFVFVFDFLILRFFFQVVCVKTGATCSSLAFSLPTDANSMHFLAKNEAKLISQPTTTRHLLQLDGQLGDGDDLQSWLSRSAHSSQLTWLV